MELRDFKIIDLGTIELKDKVIVSDPCYQRVTNDLSKKIPILPGKYTVVIWKNIETFGDGHMFYIYNSEKTFLTGFPREFYGNVGIDSGQVGMYAFEEYRKDDLVEELKKQGVKPLWEEEEGYKENPGDAWYRHACSISNKAKDIPAKLVGNGVTCESGYGDGIAKVYVKRNKEGKIYVIGVDFGDGDY